MGQALKELGVPLASRKSLRKMLAKVDADHSGTLSLAEFNSLFDVAQLHAVFESIDRDGSGAISMHEMSTALRRLGAPYSRADARRLFATVDRNHDGEVCCPLPASPCVP
jgi:solute carrier family 25 phosphate transporter 23/24/25/41